MKTRLSKILVVSVLTAVCRTAFSQGTAFTYQGRLNAGGNPATGLYDLTFAVYDMSTGGSQQGPINTNTATAVSNGLFTATVDFGGGAFTGADRWLEIRVRTNAGSGFTTLSPRQKLTPSPYAIFAYQTGPPAADSIGTSELADGSVTTPKLADSAVTRAKIATNQVVTSINGMRDDVSLLPGANVSIDVQPGSIQISSSNGPASWSLTGNSNAVPPAEFLGTVDSNALEFRVFNSRALRLEPTESTPNLIGGNAGNSVSNGVFGATIGGGGDSMAGFNMVIGEYGTISGGYHNIVAAIGNVGGGGNNDATGFVGVVGGGIGNSAFADYSVVGGGADNTNYVDYGTVGGGFGNTAAASGLFQTSATIGGGSRNTTSNQYATISGGSANWASGLGSTVSGGQNNTVWNDYDAIGGGISNQATNDYATVSGGNMNVASGVGATVPGGNNNVASGEYSFAAGINARADKDYGFVWNGTSSFMSMPTNNMFMIFASNGVAINNNNPPVPGVALSVGGRCSLSGALNAPTVVAGTVSNLANLYVTGQGNFGGAVFAQGMQLTSDARFKTHVAAIESALDIVERLRGVTFDWRRQEFPDHHFIENHQFGFVAQEIKEVLPDTVSQDAGGYYSVNYDAIIPILVEAMKEQQRKMNEAVQERDNRITELEQRLDALENIVRRPMANTGSHRETAGSKPMESGVEKLRTDP
jgi:hypothetical protein